MLKETVVKRPLVSKGHPPVGPWHPGTRMMNHPYCPCLSLIVHCPCSDAFGLVTSQRQYVTDERLVTSQRQYVTEREIDDVTPSVRHWTRDWWRHTVSTSLNERLMTSHRQYVTEREIDDVTPSVSHWTRDWWRHTVNKSLNERINEF